MINCQERNYGVIEIIKKLKADGCKIYLASNLWQSVLPHLQKLFPDVLMLFDALYFPSVENDNIYKPDPRFYTEFMKIFSLHNASSIVFIDDDADNIRAARSVGWHTILFIDVNDLKLRLKHFIL